MVTPEAKRAQNRKWYHSHRSVQIVQMKEYRTRIKNAVFAAYGGYRCACCGITEPTFLAIDHVNNDGYAHRKKIGFRGGIGLYLWLVKNEFPPGFQVLCFNCNQSKRLNGGLCVHQTQKASE